MSDLVSNLRRTRADMIGTDDEEHYWECHEAADRIEELEKSEASLLQTIKGWQKAYAELEAKALNKV
jgi:endo-1,4-beta-mannosidase